MHDKNDLIRDLVPIAGDFADDYDWDAIADEAGEFDAERGWHLRESIQDAIDADGYSDELNAIMAAHDVSATVTCELVEEGEPQSLYRVSFDVDRCPFAIAVLAGNGDPYTTSDWQGPQPATIAECAHFEWTGCSDWLDYPTTSAADRAVVRAITDELGE